MVDRLVNSEANARRIALVESCFGNSGQPLSVQGRVLVGEGVLTKACRKKLKPRQFFLFNDLLVYGNIIINKKKYNKQHIIPLEEIKLQSLEDEGQFRNGWLICTRGKSFAVYAATATEKQEWMAHIEKCIKDLLTKSGKKAASEHAAVWVPDSEATSCMICKKSQFNLVNRRHHCRKCGAVVCGACSSQKFLLPTQSSKPLRVCSVCYEELTKSATQPPVQAPVRSKRRIMLASKNQPSPVPKLPPLDEDNTEEPKPNQPPPRPPQPGGDSKNKPQEEKEEEKSEEGKAPSRPPRPPPPKINAPVEETSPNEVTSIEDEAKDGDDELVMPKRNPKLYQLVTMSQEGSSFWWDSVDAAAQYVEDDDDPLDDLIFQQSELSMRVVPEEDGKSTDSSGEDDSDDDDNGNVETDSPAWWANSKDAVREGDISPLSQIGPMPHSRTQEKK